jgi:hypothetical protein
VKKCQNLCTCRYLYLILLRIYGSRTTRNGTLENGVTLPYSFIKQTVWDEIAFFAWIIPDPLCNSDHAICYVPRGSSLATNVFVCVCGIKQHKLFNLSQREAPTEWGQVRMTDV